MLKKTLFRRFSHLFGFLLTEILRKRYRHLLGSFKRIASAHAQDSHYERNVEGICMFLINGKGFLRFLPGFCVIIFAYMESVSFGVRDS